jgi:hypothetical protein
MKRARIHWVLFASTAAVACAAPASESEKPLGSSTEAIINRDIPATYNYPTDTATVIGGSGLGAYAAPDNVSPNAVHGLNFTNGTQTSAPGQAYSDPWALDDVSTKFIYRAKGGSDYQYESSVAFPARLSDAVLRAKTDLESKVDKAMLDTAKADIDKFGYGTTTVDPIATKYWGFSPVQARWTKSQYASVPPMDPQVSAKYAYPDPTVVGELRERGARLYCTARKAVKLQAATGSTKLGEQVALPLTILGQKIDIGVIQAIGAIDDPQRYLGAARDGAQSFELSVIAGAHVIPIRGISDKLDVLPDLRYPITMATGDSEVTSALPPKSITTSKRLLCLPGYPCFYSYGTTTDSPRVDQTATHADLIGTAGSGLHWGTTFPLFTMGLLTVDMTLTTDLWLGSPVPIVAGGELDGRLFNVSGWPAPRVEGTSWLNSLDYFDDGALTIDSGYTGYYGYGLNVHSASGSYSLSPPDPMQLRTLMNDDHHVAAETKLSLGADATGHVGVTMGTLQIGLDALIGIGGSFALQHHVRDEATILHHIQAPPTWLANDRFLSNVTITPQTVADVNAHFKLTMKLNMDMGIGPALNTSYELFDPAPLTKKFGGSPWPENNRIRLGTGASGPDAVNRPATVSHLPSASTTVPTFDAFASQTVDECLADTSPNPPTPPPCGKQPNVNKTPHAQVCAIGREPDANGGFGTPAQWATACSDINGTAAAMVGGASSTYYPCVQSMLSYLCSPVSRTLTSPAGVSHIMDLSGPVATDTRFATVLKTCNTAFGSTDPNWVTHFLFDIKPCDDTARPLTKAEILSTPSTTGSTTPEPVTMPPVCH